MTPVSVFDFDSAAVFLRAWINALPKQGRGMGTKLAQFLGVSSTMVSQLLSADKALSLETGVQLAEFIGLNEMETDFFLLLIEHERAGHHRLKERVLKKIRELRKNAEDLSKRVKIDQELSESSKAIYYSSWLFTAIRNLSALPDMNDVESVAAHLRLPRPQVARVVQFLIENNLCRIEDGKLTYNKQWTHIPARSPLVVKHHQNWRIRGFQSMDNFNPEDFFLTAPMSMSMAVAAQIRARLPAWAEQIQKEVGPSDSEGVWCLNMDWFKV